MSVGRKAGKGFVSYLFRSALEKVMGIIAMIFLARKLTPYDFGLVSITEVLLTLISVIGTTGLAEFLLAYRKDDTEEIFKAAFWFNLIITLGIVILFFGAIPFWSVWQHDEKIRNISWVVGGIFIFSQLQTIPKAWFSKNLMFDKQVRIQAPFIIVVPLTKILAVFMGFGVYSLIIPTLLFQPLLTLVLYFNTTIRPTLQLHLNRWREIYHFTKHLIGATIFSRITDQGDKFILAKFLGLENLGIYNIAYQLAELVTSQVVQISGGVVSSVLPKYVHDKQLFYKHYITFLKTLSFFILPLLAILFITAKPTIQLLYGSQWLGAVLPLQIMIVAAAFKAVSSSYGSVMNSFHLNKKSFIVTIVYAPFHLAASAFGSMFGVSGLATGVTIVKTTFINWNIKQLMDAMSVRVINWYRDIAPYFLISAGIGLLITLLYRFSNIDTLQPGYTIAVVAGVFMLLYIVAFRTIYKSKAVEIGAFISITFPKLSPFFNTVLGI
jgi:O-antigen/teichoic acid export membrane protein